ncbi:hypothetical protein J6G99_02930 [bacterium]|nr:hypothetical protein [bacterium]
MNIGNVNNFSPRFSGVYVLDVNQPMPTARAALKRDASVGYWIASAKDSDKLSEQLKNFYMNDYEKNHRNECKIVLDISDDKDCDFEKSMITVGQEFDKIV